MTTFRSDDEYWAWADRQVRRMERLQRAARFAALLAVGAALVFALLMAVVKCAGAGRYDPWEQTISEMRARGGGGRDICLVASSKDDRRPTTDKRPSARRGRRALPHPQREILSIL